MSAALQTDWQAYLLSLALSTARTQTNAFILATSLCRRASEADARGYIYMLKQQGIGARSAVLQHQWASLEAAAGVKALSCLRNTHCCSTTNLPRVTAAHEQRATVRENGKALPAGSTFNNNQLAKDVKRWLTLPSSQNPAALRRQPCQGG